MNDIINIIAALISNSNLTHVRCCTTQTNKPESAPRNREIKSRLACCSFLLCEVRLLVDSQQALLGVEFDRRDGFAVPMSVPRQNAALIEMRGLQFVAASGQSGECRDVRVLEYNNSYWGYGGNIIWVSGTYLSQ
jgi:hypothetical protein